MTSENTIKQRYDFVLFFDVQDGNPNGDPDAGNLPRIDAETGMGLVTDVCLKRKVRNYIEITKNNESRFRIYIKEKAILGHFHKEAFEALKFNLGEDTNIPIPENLLTQLEEHTLPEGLSIDEENGRSYLSIASDADLDALKTFIKELESTRDKEIKSFLSKNALKAVRSRKPSPQETESGKNWMCNNFYDIRAFGAVLSLKSAPNCGQVRGPIQLTFARSVEPIVIFEHSLTRIAVATDTDKEAKKQSGDNRTMGRKYTVPYGLYRTHGFISANLAAQTGFNQTDLDLFWRAIEEMFDHDHSAARGLMTTRRLVIFEHKTALGNKAASDLFDRVTWKRLTDGPARTFGDYQILLDNTPITERKTVVTVE